MKKIFTSLAIVLSMSSFAQTICFSTPDGIDNTWTGGWSYKEYIIPAGFKIDSVYGNFDRVGYPVSNEDYIFSFCAGTTVYDVNIATSPFNYVTTTTSLYDIWIDLTSFNYSSVGVVRVFLPVNAGASWNNLCFAISPIVSSNCLIAQYNFSGNAADSSGNSLNGTVNGATLAPDRFGNPNSAYYFDGVDDYIEVLDNPLFDFATNSISYWAKIETYSANSSYNRIVISNQSGSGTSQSGFNVWYVNADGGLRLRNGASGSFGGTSIGSASNLNQWYHVVYTWDGLNGNSYVDGVIVSSGSSANASIGANNLSLLIGKANWVNINSEPFHGWIDDVNIYSCALTQQEVDSLYNTGSVSVEELQTDKLLIYPNPTSDNLHITNAKGSYFVTDIYGRVVTVIIINTDNYQLNTKSFSSGIYFLISKEDNSSIKFIKQ